MEVEKTNKSDEDSPEEMSEERKEMMRKIDDILSQYYLNSVQKFAA
jgi:hypothetical protein